MHNASGSGGPRGGSPQQAQRLSPASLLCTADDNAIVEFYYFYVPSGVDEALPGRYRCIISAVVCEMLC
jgi:hypothetical protein